LLPLQKSSNLISEKLSSEIFDMSEGTIGEITNVLTLASIEAIKSGTEKIDLKILKNIPYVRPSERRRLTDRLF
jgi:hypothetical protein